MRETRARSRRETIRTYLGIPVFEGHYTYRGMRIVPSWGGSMFEALMVPLFVPEDRWAPRSWGVNHPLYVRAQIEHGLDEAKYGFWGFSPACKPEGGYRTYGVDALGTDPGATGPTMTMSPTSQRGPQPKGRFTDGIVTPHASFLALRFAPREAMANLRKLKEKFPIYGDHGFHDSVNVSTRRGLRLRPVLDQGMIMAAIANALADDAMQHGFIDGPIEAAIRPLIAPEEFTAGSPENPPARLSVAVTVRPTRSRLTEQAVRSYPGGRSLSATTSKSASSPPTELVADIHLELPGSTTNCIPVVVEPEIFRRERKPDGPRLARPERQTRSKPRSSRTGRATLAATSRM